MDKKNKPNKLVDIEDITKVTKLKGPAGRSVSGVLLSVLKLNELNDLYTKFAHLSGFEFASAIIDELSLNYLIPKVDFENIPKAGAFIMVSNHPYGGFEGLVLLKELGKIRPDIKVMGNFLFQKVEPLKDVILLVNPFENHKGEPSHSGIKQAIAHLNDGKPLVIFPAGEVSSLKNPLGKISDRQWVKPAIKFIKNAKVPVIPAYFQGSNSLVFHSLGLINPVLRTAKLPSELLNKKKKVINIRIGSAISVKEQEKYPNMERFGRYLRARVYLLESSFELKKFFKPLFKFPSVEEPIIEPVNKEKIKLEIEQLPEPCLLFRQNNYDVYCAPPSSIPNIINELGRLRELTFREIGEGTNMKCDIDEYDLYYHHLFIWDTENEIIAGAYRIGKGNEIMYNLGVKGFYIRSLFKIKEPLYPILSQSLELGRSFIIKAYQRNPYPLFLLWKGILHFLVVNPEFRYLIGPVSISNSFKGASKSMIVDFVNRNYFDKKLASLVKPKKKFKPVLPQVDRELLDNHIQSLRELDDIIREIESKGMRIPVLLIKYLELNGKIIGFNLDPKFNNSLDGLLLLDLLEIPEKTIQMLSKEMDKNFIFERFKHINPVVFDSIEYADVPQL
jgi:putative hemolysin